MYDRVDEWVLSALTDYEGKPLQSVARGDLDPASWGAASKRETPETKEGEYTALWSNGSRRC